MATSAVLITGASKGIGLAVAQNLSSQGRQVVGLAQSKKCTSDVECGPAAVDRHSSTA